jgi:hypothetical protein
VPASAAAQLAGTEPERMRRIADVPTVVSITSSRALRTAVESWIAMWVPQKKKPAAMG